MVPNKFLHTNSLHCTHRSARRSPHGFYCTCNICIYTIICYPLLHTYWKFTSNQCLNLCFVHVSNRRKPSSLRRYCCYSRFCQIAPFRHARTRALSLLKKHGSNALPTGRRYLPSNWVRQSIFLESTVQEHTSPLHLWENREFPSAKLCSLFPFQLLSSLGIPHRHSPAIRHLLAPIEPSGSGSRTLELET